MIYDGYRKSWFPLKFRWRSKNKDLPFVNESNKLFFPEVIRIQTVYLREKQEQKMFILSIRFIYVVIRWIVYESRREKEGGKHIRIYHTSTTSTSDFQYSHRIIGFIRGFIHAPIKFPSMAAIHIVLTSFTTATR